MYFIFLQFYNKFVQEKKYVCFFIDSQIVLRYIGIKNIVYYYLVNGVSRINFFSTFSFRGFGG